MLKICPKCQSSNLKYTDKQEFYGYKSPQDTYECLNCKIKFLDSDDDEERWRDIENGYCPNCYSQDSFCSDSFGETLVCEMCGYEY